MDISMELDELKQAWRSLDRKLQQQNALQLEQQRERKANDIQSSLRPLLRGQAAQIFVGVLTAVCGVVFWNTYRDTTHLLVCGLIVHLYGIAMIVGGAFVRGLNAGIDYAAPVLEIQRKLARVRKAYVLGGLLLGLPWWLLWVPFLLVLFKGLFGADVYANAPGFVWANVAVGVIGMIGTLGFYRWSQRSNRPRLAGFMRGAVVGESLRKAQAELDALARYAEE